MSSATRVLLISGLLAGLVGCAQSPSPLDPAPGAPLAPAALRDPDDPLSLVVQLHIDPVTLSATLAPERSGASQPPQALSYDLEIGKFLSPATLQIAGVSLNIFQDVVVRFRHRHPFPAPDFASGINAANRADLSYTGRLFVLAESAHQALPGGLMADPWLVREPDGYASPGDLLRNDSGLTNTIFPYTLLVDEAKNNREGISNAGNSTGNYVAATGGWQRANAGAGGDSWTGYDYLHGGQSCLNEFTLRRTSLDAVGWSLRLAAIIQYTDPRGMGGPTKRFPSEPANVAEFAYRLPFAALDVSRVVGYHDYILHPAADATTPVNLRVRDWDTGAGEAADADLSDESDVAKVQPGAGAAPVCTLVLPDLLATPLTFTDAGGTGTATNELRYAADIHNDLGAPEGEYWGVVRVTDPEAADADRGDYHFGVDGDSLAPDPARRLPAETYLPIRVEVPPATNSWVRTWGDVGNAFCPQAVADSQGNIYAIHECYGRGNDPQPGDDRAPISVPADWSVMSLSKFDRFGNRLWTWSPGGPGYNDLLEVLVDSTDGVVLRALVQSPAVDFDPGPGTYTVVGNPDYTDAVVALDAAGQFRWGAQWPEPSGPGEFTLYLFDNMALSPADEVYLANDFQGTQDFDPGSGTVNRTSDAEGDAFVLKLSATGQYVRTRIWSHESRLWDSWQGIAATADGGVALVGNFNAPNTDGTPAADLDPTAGEDLQTVAYYQSPVIVKLDSSGAYEWGHAWLHTSTGPGDPEGGGFATNVGELSTGQLAVSGSYYGTGDFDPGPDTLLLTSSAERFDPFITNFDAGGDFLWVYGYTGLSNFLFSDRLWIGQGDSICVSNFFDASGDLDPGPGTVTLLADSINDRYLTGLAPGGSFLFAKAIGLPTSFSLESFTPTPDGRLLIAGYAPEGVDFDFGPTERLAHPIGYNEAFILNLSPEGDWD